MFLLASIEIFTSMKAFSKFAFLLFITLCFCKAILAQDIPRDKKLHLVAGAGVASFSYFTAYAMSDKKNHSLLVALGSGVVAGIAKELWDAQGYGTPSQMDAIATGIGAIIPCLIIGLSFPNKKPYLAPKEDYFVQNKVLTTYTHSFKNSNKKWIGLGAIENPSAAPKSD
jgi:hypothetical protein